MISLIIFIAGFGIASLFSLLLDLPGRTLAGRCHCRGVKKVSQEGWIRKVEDTTNAMRVCRKGPEAWFTGTVWVDQIVVGSAPSRLRVNRVSFEPGVRTAWHTHPVGQALHVFDGDRARLGVHLAMQEVDDHGIDVVWLAHLTDQEYSAP